MERVHSIFRVKVCFIILLGALVTPAFAGSQPIDNQIESDKTSLSEAKKAGDKNLQISLLKQLGANFQRQGTFDSALFYYSQGLSLAESIGSHELESSLVYNISMVHFSQGSYQTALEYALRALKLDKDSGDSTNIAASLNSVSLIYQEWGIYDKALEYRLETIRLCDATGNWPELANSHYNLGNLYLKTEKHDLALEYFTMSSNEYRKLLMEQPRNQALQLALSETVYSIGSIYLHREDHTRALEYFRQALRTKEELGDKRGIGNCYYIIGLTHIRLEQYKLAEQALLNAFDYKNQVDDKKGVALASFRIGEVNLQQSEYQKAENYFKRSINKAREIGDNEILREYYKLLFQHYSAKNKYREALDYHVRYKAYADSIVNENTTKMVEELNVRFETDKKEKENQLLARTNEVKELTIQKQRSMGFYLIGIIILVLSVLVVIYLLYRSKQKTNIIISQKNSQLEERNERIAEQKQIIEMKNLDLTDSIRYAKRIQDSMLVNAEVLNEVLSDAFILFRPKDIVSGDFYWFGKKGDKFIVSAIDCTGHGVPGAFMSMLGNTYLNKIVYDQGITSPEKILELLSQDVQAGLKQSETNNQDGMDMALCTIDLKEHIVEFAGAKNPLVYIQDGELVRLKADRLPIGRSYSADESFHNQQVKVNSTTSFYMFSDGYPDQFGGEGGGKFMVKRLQKLFLEIHAESMTKQKEILESTLDDWMKNEKQIDDILVIGFKLK